MNVEWTEKALDDVARLHEFLAAVNKSAARGLVRTLTAASQRLQENPHMGSRLYDFAESEVRHLIVSTYEVRYEILGNTFHILRVWHTREAR